MREMVIFLMVEFLFLIFYPNQRKPNQELERFVSLGMCFVEVKKKQTNPHPDLEVERLSSLGMCCTMREMA
jgi:hypothetical protein